MGVESTFTVVTLPPDMHSVTNAPIVDAARNIINRTLKSVDPKQPFSIGQIHRLRVCSKKLRALLQLYRPVYDKATIHAVEEPLKQLADLYAGSRDAEMRCKTLHHLIEHRDAEHRGAVTPVLQYFAAEKTAVWKTLPEIDLNAAFTAVLQHWQHIFPGADGVSFAEGIGYSYNKARQQARKAAKWGETDHYHGCRRWLKYHFYQIKMSGFKRHRGVRKHIRRARALEILLGTLHDQCLLEASLAALPKTDTDAADDANLQRAGELALRWCRKQLQRDKARCNRRLKRFFAEKHWSIPD